MRVLVTGGTGFVGSHTIAALVRAGHGIRALVRDPAKLARVMATHGLPVPEHRVGDVTDAADVEAALEGCDSVVHAAAVVGVIGRDEGDAAGTNARGVELVVGGAHARGLRSIVYVSSASAIFTPRTGPVTVDSPLASWKSVYARSKADAERFVRGLQAEGAPIRTTYPPAVVGPDDPGMSEANYAILTFLRQTMVRTSGGYEIIDVRDLAAVHAMLVDPSAPAGRYLLGDRIQPWDDVIALMDELTGRRVPRFPAPGPLLRFSGRIGDLVRRVWAFQFPLTAEAMDHATQWPGIVTSPEAHKLGIERRAARDTYADTIRWMHRAGHLTRSQTGLLAEGP